MLGLALLYSYFDVVKFISIHTAIGAILTYAYVLRVWRFITKDIDSILKDLFYEARDIYYSEQDPEIRTTVYIHMDWLRSNKF